MNSEKLYRELGKLGLPFFEVDVDPNKIIAEVVKSKNTRLWEGFPVLLANVNREGTFAYEAVIKFLKNAYERNNFQSLILLSLALYRILHLQFLWAKHLKDELQLRKADGIKEIINCFNHNVNFIIGNKIINPQKVVGFFNNYFKGEDVDFDKANIKSKELSLEYALSQVFTPKQKLIFLKRIRREKLTKSERTLFYRTIKKKAMALLNQELRRLAEQLL